MDYPCEQACELTERRRRDSNPRLRFTPNTHLAGGRLQPLGHVSGQTSGYQHTPYRSRTAGTPQPSSIKPNQTATNDCGSSSLVAGGRLQPLGHVSKQATGYQRGAVGTPYATQGLESRVGSGFACHPKPVIGG